LPGVRAAQQYTAVRDRLVAEAGGKCQLHSPNFMMEGRS
jgi:hypothetical protein